MRRHRYWRSLARLLGCAAVAVLCLTLVAPASADYFFDDFDDVWPYDATGTVPPGSGWDGGYNFGAGGPHDSSITNAGNLTMGMDGVGWEVNNTSGPMQYVTVDASMPFSARVKVSSQTNGFWSLAGLIVRLPQALGSGAERYVTTTGFRLGPDPDGSGNPPPFGTGYAFQMTAPQASGENEINVGSLAEADLNYLRIDNLLGGTFEGFSSADGVKWIPRGTRTNLDLAAGPLEVGLHAGALGALANSTAVYDWFEVFMVPEPASLSLAVLGAIAGYGLIRRRRR